MSGLVWESPSSINSGVDWAQIAAELKSRPGEWAVIGTDVSQGSVLAMRQGRNSAFRPIGSWEFVTRENKGNRAGKLFARYTEVSS